MVDINDIWDDDEDMKSHAIFPPIYRDGHDPETCLACGVYPSVHPFSDFCSACEIKEMKNEQPARD